MKETLHTETLCHICKSKAWIGFKIFSVFFVENYDILRFYCNLNFEEPPVTLQREGSNVRSRSSSCWCVRDLNLCLEQRVDRYMSKKKKLLPSEI